MKLIEKIIKAEIRSLVRTKDTFDERFDYLRLDKNERLMPFRSELFERFKEEIHFEDLSGYSELGPAYRKLAQSLSCSEESLLLAAGSDLAIKSLYEACVGPGDSVVLHAPSYAMYRVYAQMFGAEARTVALDSDWNVDFHQMLKCVDEGTKLMALENPNGFVGGVAGREQIVELASELNKRNVILLIDEAYYYVENTGPGAHQLIDRFPNVVVAQTFSKAHGLAGLRIGYLIAHPQVMEFVRRVRPMHEIASLAACALVWLLDHPELLCDYQAAVAESKAHLRDGLDRLAISYRDTHANFLLLNLPDRGPTAQISERLKKERILIRRPFHEGFLKGWSRVCVGSIENSDRFLGALERLLAQT